MIPNLTAGIMVGIGFAAWVYGKLQQSTGGNTQNSFIGAAVCGLLAAVVVTTLLGLLF